MAGSSLPAERLLTVRDLRQVEQAQREAERGSRPPTSTAVPQPVVPVAGEHRRRWLRGRLLAVMREDMDCCPLEEGVETVVILELFERVTQEAFTATPGTLVGQRLQALARVLGNVLREEEFDPPLEQVSRRRGVVWNRRPQVAVDVDAWRRQQESVESRAAPMPRLRNQVAAVNAGLAGWICNHRYLVPTEAAAGESGMALLIMWEVDHDRAFPSEGGDGLTAGLVGFTRRLLERVARDPRLEWLDSVEMAAPLGPGLAPTHHRDGDCG